MEYPFYNRLSDAAGTAAGRHDGTCHSEQGDTLDLCAADPQMVSGRNEKGYREAGASGKGVSGK